MAVARLSMVTRLVLSIILLITRGLSIPLASITRCAMSILKSFLIACARPIKHHALQDDARHLVWRLSLCHLSQYAWISDERDLSYARGNRSHDDIADHPRYASYLGIAFHPDFAMPLVRDTHVSSMLVRSIQHGLLLCHPCFAQSIQHCDPFMKISGQFKTQIHVHPNTLVFPAIFV